MTTEITISESSELTPAKLLAPTPKAARWVVEFFTGQINKDHTRRVTRNLLLQIQDKVNLLHRSEHLEISVSVPITV
jgi:hypothetical protein